MSDILLYHEVIALLNSTDKELPNRKKHRLALEQYTFSDREFFFTICARQHGQPFLNPSLAESVIASLLWTRERYHWYLFCYCLMPDHLHFILQLPDVDRVTYSAGIRGKVIEGVLEHVGRFKSYTTTQCWWKHGGYGKLWQKSSYDHIIRHNDSVVDAVWYVLNNPTRKGSVKSWSNIRIRLRLIPADITRNAAEGRSLWTVAPRAGISIILHTGTRRRDVPDGRLHRVQVHR